MRNRTLFQVDSLFILLIGAGWILSVEADMTLERLHVETAAWAAPSPKVSISAKSTRNPAAEPVGEDWPNFLGPHFNATSRETGLLKSWPPGGPPVLWSRQLGASYSAPVTSRGHLVLFHRLGMEEVVECVDARTGVKIWKQSYPSTYVDQFGYNNGPRSSPTIDGSRVYTFGAEGKLTSLDFETGRILWQRLD